MEYAVELSVRARRDLEEIFLHIRGSDSGAARSWFNGLERAIRSLYKFPRRCPPAREARMLRRPLRQLLYGKKPDVYRLLYEIDEVSRIVFVYSIRHGARDDWDPARAK